MPLFGPPYIPIPFASPQVQLLHLAFWNLLHLILLGIIVYVLRIWGKYLDEREQEIDRQAETVRLLVEGHAEGTQRLDALIERTSGKSAS